MFKSNHFLSGCLKRTVILLSILFITTSLHARVTWDFELKAKPAVNFVNEKNMFKNTQYIDFLAMAGLDVTLCFGRYVGLDVFLNYIPLCYPISEVESDNFKMGSGILGGGGIAIMIPFTDTLKIKTVIGCGVFEYARYSIKYTDPVGDNKKHSMLFEKMGLMGSVSCVWMPVKHFGLTFGTDLCIESLKGKEQRLPQSGYKYTPEYFQVFVSPYIGGVIKLGRVR